MKKMIAIVAFITVAFVSASALAQEPVGPRNRTAITKPDDAFHVIRLGRELQPGWLVLINHMRNQCHRPDFEPEVICRAWDDCEPRPVRRRPRRIAVVTENHELLIINTGKTRPIRDYKRYRVAAADSRMFIHQP